MADGCRLFFYPRISARHRLARGRRALSHRNRRSGGSNAAVRASGLCPGGGALLRGTGFHRHARKPIARLVEQTDGPGAAGIRVDGFRHHHDAVRLRCSLARHAESVSASVSGRREPAGDHGSAGPAGRCISQGLQGSNQAGDGRLRSLPAAERGGARPGAFRSGVPSHRVAALAGRSAGTGRLAADRARGRDSIPAAGARIERLRNRCLGDAADCGIAQRWNRGPAARAHPEYAQAAGDCRADHERPAAGFEFRYGAADSPGGLSGRRSGERPRHRLYGAPVSGKRLRFGLRHLHHSGPVVRRRVGHGRTAVSGAAILAARWTRAGMGRLYASAGAAAVRLRCAGDSDLPGERRRSRRSVRHRRAGLDVFSLGRSGDLALEGTLVRAQRLLLGQ